MDIVFYHYYFVFILFEKKKKRRKNCFLKYKNKEAYDPTRPLAPTNPFSQFSLFLKSEERVPLLFVRHPWRGTHKKVGPDRLKWQHQVINVHVYHFFPPALFGDLHISRWTPLPKTLVHDTSIYGASISPSRWRHHLLIFSGIVISSSPSIFSRSSFYCQTWLFYTTVMYDFRSFHKI